MDMGEKGVVAEQHRPPPTEVDEFALASESPVSEEVALDKFFGGNKWAMEKVKEDARRIADWWEMWYRTECPALPPVLRLDFLVSYPDPPGSATPDVWTCQV